MSQPPCVEKRLTWVRNIVYVFIQPRPPACRWPPHPAAAKIGAGSGVLRIAKRMGRCALGEDARLMRCLRCRLRIGQAQHAQQQAPNPYACHEANDRQGVPCVSTSLTCHQGHSSCVRSHTPCSALAGRSQNPTNGSLHTYSHSQRPFGRKQDRTSVQCVLLAGHGGAGRRETRANVKPCVPSEKSH
jgi:hypothetical protein